MFDARVAALEALAPEHREAAAAAQKQARERRSARKAEMLERARRIFALHDEGHTAIEIARAVGRAHGNSVRQFAAKCGILISRSELIARLAGNVTIEYRDALRRMADDYGETPGRTFEDLLTFMLADDATIARRTLRVSERRRRRRGPRSHKRRRGQKRDDANLRIGELVAELEKAQTIRTGSGAEVRLLPCRQASSP